MHAIRGRLQFCNITAATIFTWLVQERLFDCGTAIRNTADNVVDSKDQIIFHIEGFVSNDAFPRRVSWLENNVNFRMLLPFPP